MTKYVTTKQLMEMGAKFVHQGDEPYDVFDAVNDEGEIIAIRNSNVWPEENDIATWELIRP